MSNCLNSVGDFIMTSIKRESRKRRQRKYARRHKRSMLLISMTMVMLVAVVSVNGLRLYNRNQDYIAQEAELKNQIAGERGRFKELDELKEYVGTDAYIENVAKEKLGLVFQDEILFKAKE